MKGSSNSWWYAVMSYKYKDLSPLSLMPCFVIIMYLTLFIIINVYCIIIKWIKTIVYYFFIINLIVIRFDDSLEYIYMILELNKKIKSGIDGIENGIDGIDILVHIGIGIGLLELELELELGFCEKLELEL